MQTYPQGRCPHRPCGTIFLFRVGFGEFVLFFLRADVGIGPYNKIYLIDKLKFENDSNRSFCGKLHKTGNKKLWKQTIEACLTMW